MTIHQTISFAATVAFLTAAVLPAEALAFEATANSTAKQVLIAPVKLNNRLPKHEIVATGSIVATTNPVTPRRPAPAVPASQSTLVLEGEASYYSRAGCLGCDPFMIMANGQPLNDNALTMAIGADKKQFVGHTARVTSLTTGKSAIVRITDTGGFYQAKYGHRVADLTIATKQAIGMKGGVGPVRVEVF